MKKSRYIVGIDLGTTTTSLSYIDKLSSCHKPKGLPILQWEKEGSTIEDCLLPSFCYIASKKEVKQKKFLLPFYENSKDSLEDSGVVVGRFAQSQQELNPGRVVSSAKSWLCHGGVNREDKILPWNSDDLIGEQRFSPVEVLSFILLHLKLYWNSTLAKHSEEYRLEEQDVIITIPASFNEVALNLTVKAAKLAGFVENQIRLIEEPQAAFYFWANEILAQEKKNKEQSFELLKDKIPGLEQNPKNILVCDIGGGTCDFSLFALSFDISEDSDLPLKIKRKAVSRHILLGGDNLDLKIASLFETAYVSKYKNNLSSKQWASIISSARQIKEKILIQADSQEKNNDIHLSISNESRNLFAGTQTITVPEDMIRTELLEGFFPLCEKNTMAEKDGEEALKEWNLPYAKNPAFSHHLAQFVKGQKIDGILFVGGTLIPSVLRLRLLDLIESWQKVKPFVLNEKVYSLSVSKGASDYGHSFLSDKKIKIKAGYPRSLYLEIERMVNGFKEKALVCVVSKGYSIRDVPATLENLSFKLAVNKPVSFNLYGSESGFNHEMGSVVSLDYKKFSLLAPLESKIELQKKKSKGALEVDTFLQVELTTVGLLKIFCCEKSPHSQESVGQKWPLEFNVQDSSFRTKGVSESQNYSSLPDQGSLLEKASSILLNYFGKSSGTKEKSVKPKASKILSELQQVLGQPKQDWNLLVLRKFLDSLIKNQNSRLRSAAHESAWFNLSGYFFRPGYGHSLDSMRIHDIWPIFSQGLKHSDVSQVQNEWWVFWRRVSGGLNKEQQNKIFGKIIPQIRNKKASAEMILAVGALELVDLNKKILLGNFLVRELLAGESLLSLEQKFWTLTRISCRFPLYSGPENIVRPSFIQSWFDQLSSLSQEKKKKLKPLLVRYYLYSGRVVDDREFDLGPELRLLYQRELESLKVEVEQINPVLSFVALEKKEKLSLMGETLPTGLILS